VSIALAERVVEAHPDALLRTWLEGRIGAAKAISRLERERCLEHGMPQLSWRQRVLSRGSVTDFWAPLALRASGLLGRGTCNASEFSVSRTDVVLERLPKAFEGFSVLHLTDLHGDTSRRAMEALPRVLERLDYDVCVITGDFRGKAYGPHGPSMDIVARLIPHVRSPVFGILGNHDPAAVAPELEDMGVRMLMNEAVSLSRGADRLWIAGVDDPHFYETHDFEAAMAEIPDADCRILLSHSTDHHEDARLAGADLLLCGHTHGGQICLPGGIPVLTSCNQPRSMATGPWRHGNMLGYTSRGVGTSAVEARFNCPPEVTLHRLSCGPANGFRIA
jgi:predicted MPP superfamily phosphohydrolase